MKRNLIYLTLIAALMAAALLTGCQAPQGKFTPEQVAAMKSYGFTESNGDWSLGLSDSILFDKNDYRLRPDSRQHQVKLRWLQH